MNRIHLQRFLTLSLGFCLFGAFITACGQTAESVEPPSLQPFPLAPEMESYYREVGGEEVLGALISPRLEEGNYVYQYTVNALMFRTKGVGAEREVGFVPIGLDLSLPSLGTRNDGSRISAFPIHQEFLPLYEKLGSERVGSALSGLRYNPRQGRYEQFFEGVGMYRLETDPPGRAKLMAYGVWKCGMACLYPVPAQAEVIPPKRLDPRVVSLVERLGVDLTGFPLSPAIQGPDGKDIVIFENVVIEVPSVGKDGVKLLPLPQRLGILAEGMVANHENDQKIFLSLHGDKGHHIWRSFMSYIDAHGGLELIGLPIGEPIEWEQGSIRQCFENLCLLEDRQIEGVYRIRPSPLGFEYASLYFPSEYVAEDQSSLSLLDEPSATLEADGASNNLNQEIILEILESRPFVDQQTHQEIGVIVRIGGRLATGVRPVLYLSLIHI
ncbi:MAG: hypothetical protein N3D16_04025, partial [Anaerolineales bacterium]|nr:hypothetical protein [Anaerolineales bacterium]